MSDRYIGKRIGNYRVTEPLASGGFGHVYKATHTIIKQRTVAIKFLRTHLRTEREQERFMMEAELLEMLQHPHILRIYDTGIDDDNVPYIITEFAVQGSLREYLKHYHHTPLPLTKAQTIIVQVGQALQHAHQNNVIHRDFLRKCGVGGKYGSRRGRKA